MLSKQPEAAPTKSNTIEGGRLQNLFQGAARVAVLMTVFAGTAYQAFNSIRSSEMRGMSDPDAREQIIKKANEYCRQACTEAGVDFESIGFTEEVVERLYLEAASATEEGLETVRRQKKDPSLPLPRGVREAQTQQNLEGLIYKLVEHSEKGEY